jgi:mycoredoxin
MAGITIYGADWCHMTADAREHLDELGVGYEYINIERNPSAAKWVREQNCGKERKPTVDIHGHVLSEPSNEELDAALAEAGVSY